MTSKKNEPLFSSHEHALEREFEVCPDCGSELVIKNSKAGAFLGCASYPTCQYTRPVVEHQRIEEQILAGSECPECQHELAVKQGRYGMFIGCTNYPDCHYIAETHHNEDAGVACPACKKGELFEKTNRFGKTFYACDNYPKCKFVVNHKPVIGKCEECGFDLLVERHMAAGLKYQCANKRCATMQKEE